MLPDSRSQRSCSLGSVRRSAQALALALWAVGLVGATESGYFSADPWILINSRSQTLSVIKDGEIVLEFQDVALGRGGIAENHRRGDGSTPVGDFRISEINRRSRYGTFFRFDYPTLEHAERAYQAGQIDRVTYLRFLYADRDNREPPQDTPLGGYIGIHGLGRADPTVHQEFNWTQGCVALTNQQVRELSRWVQVGTRVVIR